jgi:N-acetylglucosamine-6-phosphate deacetylase
MKITGRVVTPERVLDHGVIEIDGGRITSVGERDADPAGTDVRSGGWIVPGFVDIHTHGGGGYTFTTGDPDEAREAARFHLGYGTTTLLASLVSSPYELMHNATKAYLPLVAEGVLGGIHFEGPYLSPDLRGAQNAAYLRDPSTAELAALIATGEGAIRMVTLAPERVGALDAIDLLARNGVIAALGHSDATYEQTLTGIAAGASVGTHVFNGMRPPHHRRPGPVFALLGAPSVVCEFVADGHHLHDGTLAFATGVTGPDRAMLVTDAISAAGVTDGDYELSGQPVVVSGGVARLASNGSIAGSTLTMDAALRRVIAVGTSIVDACRMASTTPARVLGRADIGAITPGRRADLVELSESYEVVRVMRGGAWHSA